MKARRRYPITVPHGWGDDKTGIGGEGNLRGDNRVKEATMAIYVAPCTYDL